MRFIKSLLKIFVPSKILAYQRKIRTLFQRIDNLERNFQNILWLNNLSVSDKYKQRDLFKKHEYKVFSQHGEDGILLYIFDKVGTTNKVVVEIGIEDGKECNSANLIINFGWKGLLIEGNKSFACSAEQYFSSINETHPNKVKIISSFVTRENINSIFDENDLYKEIDLLSIDIDGNDYWIWDAIERIEPRVVIIEYNSIFGTSASRTVKYNPIFKSLKEHSSGWYYGASISALNKLAKRKGYTLVACDSSGVNAFFIKNEVMNSIFKELTVDEAFYDQETRIRFGEPHIRFSKIKHLEYQDV